MRRPQRKSRASASYNLKWFPGVSLSRVRISLIFFLSESTIRGYSSAPPGIARTMCLNGINSLHAVSTARRCSAPTTIMHGTLKRKAASTQARMKYVLPIWNSPLQCSPLI